MDRLTPVLVLVSIGLAFAVGVLWQKVDNLEGGTAPRKAVAGTEDTANAGTGTNDVAPAGPTQGKLSADQASKIIPVSADDHVRGSRDAKVYLVEYSDLECPFCSQFHSTAQQAVDEYNGQVAWVYRHFPLESLHPRAREAALGSECVSSMGGDTAFWSYVDEIFADQTTKLSNLTSVATSAGVSGSDFDSCVDGEKFADLIDEQYQGGLTAGVTGTPGNFIVNSNGDAWLIPGAVPFDQLKATIDEALQG